MHGLIVARLSTPYSAQDCSDTFAPPSLCHSVRGRPKPRLQRDNRVVIGMAVTLMDTGGRTPTKTAVRKPTRPCLMWRSRTRSRASPWGGQPYRIARPDGPMVLARPLLGVRDRRRPGRPDYGLGSGSASPARPDPEADRADPAGGRPLIGIIEGARGYAPTRLVTVGATLRGRAWREAG